MALADILTRIEADAAAEAGEIVAAAEVAAAMVDAETRETTERLHASIVEQAEREARREADTILAGARLAARDRALAARAELIDEVMNRAHAALIALDDEAYAAFFADRIVRSARGGELILLGADDRPRLEERILPAVERASAQHGETLEALALGDEAAPFAHGVMLVGPRMRTDLSLDAIVDERRGELEMIVSDVLFGAE